MCADHLIDSWVLIEVCRRTDESQASARRHSLVYYLRLPSGQIMIGHTTNLPARLPTFGLAMADVLAVEPGGLAWELHRHEQFARLRTSLLIEEFSPHPDLRAHIDSLRLAWGRPGEVAHVLARANQRHRDRTYQAISP